MNEGQIQTEQEAIIQSRTLFKPASWTAKIDFINHLILLNNVLITVLSEKKGGKSSFKSLLQSNLDKQVKSIAMTIEPPCDKESLIDSIAAQLHLNRTPGSHFSSLVAQVNERKAHVLVIFDDAQHIPEECVKDIVWAIKSQGDFGFFHVCLVSDYSIVATLNALDTDQLSNLIHTLELEPLSENETRTYVLQRAMTAQLIHKPLPDAQLKRFYRLTKGNIVKINDQLESFILQSSNKDEVSKSKLLKKMGMAAVGLAALGLSYISFNGLYPLRQFPHMENSTAPSTEPELEPKPLIQQQAAVVSESDLISEPVLVSQIPSWLDFSTVQLIESNLAEKQDLDERAEQEVQVNTALTHTAEIAAADIPAKEVIAEAARAQALDQHQKVALTKKLHKEAALKPKVTNAYTIQLAASHSMKDVKQFKLSNKLLAETKVRHFSNAKGHWYVLTYGEFTNRNQAQAHVNKLPAQLAKLNPWIRPVSGLSNIG